MGDKLARANNAFGFDLLCRLTAEQPRQNLFLSPASISLALSMTAAGADEATAVALQRALRLEGLDWTAVHQTNAQLWQALQTADPQTILAMANSIWAEPGFPFAADFVTQVQQHYAARIENLNFKSAEAVDIVNEWVSEQTRGKISDLLAPGSLEQAVLLLVNAIYFKGKWQRPFDQAFTQEGVFNLVTGRRKKLPMMRQSGKFAYAETADYQSLNLPFGDDGRFSFIILLPAPHKSLAELVGSLTPDSWQTAVPHLKRSFFRSLPEGTVIMPRFKASYQRGLLGDLRYLGFNANRFPRMSSADDELMISDVIHQAVLEVNEEGAEAAAATAVVVARSAMGPQSSFRMTVDRPFFCAIQDNESGAALFMGAIYDPAG
jgi:serine protease inhibitor